MLGDFWNKKMQSASEEDLRKMQLKLLRRQIGTVYEKSRFYRRKLKGKGVSPSQIRSLEDVVKIPFTSREELEGSFYDVLPIPFSEVATIRLSSGTTGHPLRIAHSREDISMIAEASARKLVYHGATSKDVIQVTAAYGLWQGAWSMHWGAERIGACVIPVGPADTERQILIMKQFKTTVLYGVTNYHFRILEVAKALGEDPTSYSLRTGICVAEKPSKAQIEALKKGFGYEKVAIDYGATEFPGFSVNCEQDPETHHVWADFYLVEVVDPETHEPLEVGEKGELVVTSLQRQAFPLIRYLSRDLTRYFGFGECECGMAHPKVSADIDREDYMTKIRGVAVFPSHVEFIVGKFAGLTGKCQIIADKRTPRHEATLKVEMDTPLPLATQKQLRPTIVDEIKNRVGITFNEVTFVPRGTFETKYKKAIIVT